jgi:E3 ubiquitin-protein ligase UBR1
LIALNYLVFDREYDLSILTFSVQLFTVPTIASLLCQTTSLIPLLFSTIKTLFLSDSIPALSLTSRFFASLIAVAAKPVPFYPKINCESEKIFKRHRFFHLFIEFRYLLTAAPVRLNGFRDRTDFFLSFLDFCTLIYSFFTCKQNLNEFNFQLFLNYLRQCYAGYVSAKTTNHGPR